MVFSGDLLNIQNLSLDIHVDLTKVLDSTWASIKYFAFKYK